MAKNSDEEAEKQVSRVLCEIERDKKLGKMISQVFLDGNIRYTINSIKKLGYKLQSAYDKNWVYGSSYYVIFDKIAVKEYNGYKHNIYTTNRQFKRALIGRKDKDGVPIREGDVIEVMDNIDWGGVVTYNEKCCGFGFDAKDMRGGTFSHSWGEGQECEPEEDWKIVGSIYK